MKSVIIHADGRRINLAAAIGADLYEELENTHSPKSDPALRCGGCGGGIYVRHGAARKDELFGAHHDAGSCPESLLITAPRMSDEHKRQAEYHVRAAERAGHSADMEVWTTGRTRVDVVVDGRTGFEIQRSQLTKAAAVSRTARSSTNGLDVVAWFTDKGETPQWYGHVPSYTTAATAWDFLPLPGSITASGLRMVTPVRCGTRGPCFHERPCNRTIAALDPWAPSLDDVVRSVAEGAIAPVRIGRLVRLMSAESIALWAELTGERPGYDAGRPEAHPLAPSTESECERPAVTRPVGPMFADIGPRLVWGGFVHNES